MRKFLICAVLLAVGEAAIPTPGQTTVYAATGASADKPQSITISKLPSVSVSKDWADWGYWGFGLLLVFVGFLQVRLMKRQANLMKAQTDLMAIQFEQSISINNWQAKKFSSGLHISVELENSSSYRLTIKSGQITINEGVAGKIKSELGDNTFLPPHGKYTCHFNLVISPRDLQTFDSSFLSFPVSGLFSYIPKTDASKIIHQRFTGLLNANSHGAWFDWMTHMNPIEQARGDQNPN